MSYPSQRLAELSTGIAQGAPLLSTRVSDDDLVPVINPRDLAAGAVPGLALLDRSGVQPTPRSSRARVKGGDVLVTARGTQLRTAVVPSEAEGATASANLLVVRLGAELLPEVLVAFLRSSAGERQLVAQSMGTTAGTFLVTAKSLGAIEVAVPPMHVQQQLAAFARASATALAASERLLELRRELFNGVVEAVFAGSALDSLGQMEVA